MRILAPIRRAALLAAALALPVHAQIGNPAGNDPASAERPPGAPSPDALNVQDRLFIMLASAGNLGEIAAGRLAADRSGSARVQNFGRRMVQDHGQNRDKLAGLARSQGVPTSDAPQPDQQAVQEWLTSLSGGSFDAAYLQSQLIDHQKTAQLLQWEISSGQNAELKQVAMETLPVVLDHLRMAQLLFADLTGTEPQGLAASGMAYHDGRPDER